MIDAGPVLETAGEVGGVSLDVRSVVYILNRHEPADPLGTAIDIYLFDTADGCERLQTNHDVPRSVSLTLGVAVDGGGAVQPGTYQVEIESAPNDAVFQKVDCQCSAGLFQQFGAGTVTLTGAPSLDGGGPPLEGSYALSFDGGSISGSFSATFCDPGSPSGETCN